jgi:calcium-dependent protein kinase
MSARNNRWVLPERTGRFEEKYVLGRKLGEGGFGIAYRCTHLETKDERAVKIMPKRNISQQQAVSLNEEYKFMTDLDHPNIIKAYDAFETESHFYIVMELCGDELFTRIIERKRYSERDAAGVLTKILAGIQFLHHHRIAHCDLKPDNFLFVGDSEDAELKIIDFGMSKRTARLSYRREMLGTPYYMAPEVVEKKYTFHCDMWSIGVILFVMLFGYPPFRGDGGRDDTASITRSILTGFDPTVKRGFGAYFPQRMPVSDNAKDLMRRLLQSDPSLRLTAEEALNHPWIAHQDANSTDPLTGMVGNWSSFQHSSRCKNAVLKALCSAVDDEDALSLRATFARMDVDGDGQLEGDELLAAIERSTSEEEKATIQSLLDFGMMNSTGEGCSITFQDLVMASLAKKLASKEERMRNVFEMLDLDGDGKISASELGMCLGEYLDSGESVEAVIAEVDTDGDGQIDYEEFVAMFMQRELTKESDAVEKTQ